MQNIINHININIMTEKKQFYETPQIEFCCELLPSARYLVEASVQESLITDSDPYFDDLV